MRVSSKRADLQRVRSKQVSSKTKTPFQVISDKLK